MISALIFVPLIHNAQFWRDLCADYCLRHGYHIALIVSEWAVIEALLNQDPKHVVVAARRDHLPPDRLPRLEVATEPQTAPPPPSQTRPRRIRPKRTGGS